MTPMLAANGPTWFWYLARGSGLVALVLLTLSMVLGIVTSVRWSSQRWPRFALQLVHRNVSLLVVVFIALHVSTIVIDGFAPIGWKDTVIPFLSGYRAIWLGLGAIAFDLVLALTITSLVRHRIGHRTWRAIHWFAYLCWPLTVVHGLGSGTDAKLGFVVVTNVVCVVAVIAAVWWRIAVDWPDQLGARVASLGATILGPLGLALWAASGPLATGWAREAGTPASLLPNVRSVSSATPTPTTSPSRAASGSLPDPPFSAAFSGTQQDSQAQNGELTSRIQATLRDGASGELAVVLTGPVDEQGLLIRASRVTLGSTSRPSSYVGQVTDVSGDELFASMTSTDGPSLELTIRLRLDTGSGRVNGRLRADAAGQRGNPSSSVPSGQAN